MVNDDLFKDSLSTLNGIKHMIVDHTKKIQYLNDKIKIFYLWLYSITRFLRFITKHIFLEKKSSIPCTYWLHNIHFDKIV